jgi:ubiquinone/menaquinone biosynthesis C-methylase UbiE
VPINEKIKKVAEVVTELYGIDLTEKAVEHTRTRWSSFGLVSNLSVGDAEELNFPDESFDIVYSWGECCTIAQIHLKRSLRCFVFSNREGERGL